MLKTPDRKAALISSPEVVALLANPHAIKAAPAELASAAVDLALVEKRPDALWTLSTHPDKEIGKAAKRALHLLRSRGIEVGERPAPPLATPPAAEPEAAPEPCRATTWDGFGERAVWIPNKIARGLELWEAILSDETGVRALQRAELSRRQLRTHFQSMPQDAILVFEISRDRALALLAQAVLRGGGDGELGAARELLERLGQGDEAQLQTAAARATPLPVAEEAAALRESAVLFEEPELQSYLPPEDLLRQLAAKLDEVAVSPLLLDQRQKLERGRHLLEQAVVDYFTSERRRRYADRLFELSEAWSGQARTPVDRLAAAAARQLQGTTSILENPWATQLFERIFRAAPPPAEPAKTAAGLILPPA